MIDGYKIAEANGKPAKERFSDPVALRTVYDQLTRDDVPDAMRRAKIRRLYEGYLPYSAEALRKSGLRHLTNVNWHGLKGVIDNRAATILRLACDTTNLVTLLPLGRELAGPDAEVVARVVAEEFSTTVRNDGRIIPALSRMNKEADLYGFGPVTWVSPIDYHPVALERAQVRFIGDGPVNSSEHELFMFETTLPASYMFFLMDNPEIATGAGWDLAAVKEWIVKAFVDDIPSDAQPGVENGTSYIENAISYVRQNRFEETHQFSRLRVIHAFVREMALPRGITHIIMPSTEQKRFLFHRSNAYRTMDQCFLWFPYSCTDTYAKEVRGLGSDLYPIELANNRFKCRVMDIAFQYASVMFSQTSLGGQQTLTLNEQGPYTVVPKELVPIQNNVKPDMNTVMSFSQFVDNMGVNSVVGSDKPMLSQTGPKLTEGSGRESKFEVELRNRLRSRKEEQLFIQRMNVLDKIFRETFRRFLLLANSNNPVILADYPEITDFVKRCSMRGVTPDKLMLVPQMFDIITCRDLVLGSEGKVGVLSEILGSFGAMADEPGRKSMFRDIVQLRLGDQAADRYAAEISRDQAPSDQSSFATLENNMMKQGLPPLVGGDQMHWAHIPVHAQVLQEIVETVRAPQDNQPEADTFGNPVEQDADIAQRTLQAVNNDPRRTLLVLQLCSKHVQEHLQFGARQLGMEAQAKQVMSMIQGLRPTVKALNLAIRDQERVEEARREKQEREMQALQERASQNELDKAKYETDRKTEVERYRVDREHEVAMHRADLEAGRADAQAAREDERFANDERRRDMETASRIGAQERLAAARENAARSANAADIVNDVTGYAGTSPADVATGTVPDYETSI